MAMVTMDDLIARIRAAIDEDERIAQSATQGTWTVNSETYAEYISTEDGTDVVAGGRWGGEASVFNETADAIHIARHDPARVLRQVDAFRDLLDAAEADIRVGLPEPAGRIIYNLSLIYGLGEVTALAESQP